jgi:catechol 2,3-dioxygenase-like lactoylglutathione lyase family enzyme
VTDPLVSRIDVVYFYVRDLERSIAFYRDVLGIPVEGDDHWAEATLENGVRFALHATEGDADLGSGTLKVDFEVANIEDAAARLRAAGVEVGETERDDWGAACEFVDPDGYRLHLFERPAG